MSNILDSSKEKSIQDIYHKSARLLELINFLLRTIQDYESKLPAGLSKEIYDTCFELGSELAVMEDFLEESSSSPYDDWVNGENPYPFGM